MPPLRYDQVYRLKQESAHLTIVINGGVSTAEHITEHLGQVDGVMIGRQAYHSPWDLAAWDDRFYGTPRQ